MNKRDLKLNFEDILSWLIIFDLILGGTGYIISVGGISFRFILMGLSVFAVLIHRQIHLQSHSIHLTLIVFYFSFWVIISGTLNGFSDAIDEYLGYISFLPYYFFYAYFRSRPNKIEKKINLIFCFLIILSVIAGGIWLYCFIKGPGAYGAVQGFLGKYNYGAISYLDGGVPRVFLKTSVFLPISCFFAVDLFFKHKKVNRIILIILAAFSILISFTAGIYLGAIAGLICYLLQTKRFGDKKNLLRIILIVVFLGSYFVCSTALLDTFFLRYKGYNSFNIKYEQFLVLIHNWLENPILGKGFGKIINIRHSNGIIRTNSKFEISWLQLLCHTGMVGFLLFTSHIVITLKRCRILLAMRNESKYSILFSAIICLCIASFSNPYMNNSIGLVLYAIITAIVDVQYEDTEAINFAIKHK